MGTVNAVRALYKVPTTAMMAELSEGKETVDLATFTEWVGLFPECPLEELTEAFNTFDTNGNGYVSLPELKHIMQALGEGLTDAEVAGMEKAAGADAEGQVNIRSMCDV